MSSRWNYWIDVYAGNRDWVDFDNVALDRICFSVLPTEFTPTGISGVLVLPLGVEPGDVDFALEGFPENTLPRIPDFTFSINAGYTSPDGSFSASDILAALAQYNATQGKYFDIVGCRVSLVAGYSDHTGIWYDDGWKSSVGAFSSPAPAPSINDRMVVYHSAIVSSVEKNGVDTITISTTYPDDNAVTGTVVGTDSDKQIKIVAYGDDTNSVECELNNGIIEVETPVNDVALFYKASSDGALFQVDPDCYKYSDGVIDFRKASKSSQFLYYQAFQEYQLGAWSNPSRPTSMWDLDSNGTIDVTLDEEKTLSYSIEAENISGDLQVESCLWGYSDGPGRYRYSESDQYMLCDISGKVIPLDRFTGRSMNGTDKLLIPTLTTATADSYLSSSVFERKYIVRYTKTAVPFGAYAIKHPDEPEEYSPELYHGNGDLQELRVNSLRSVPYNASRDWSTQYATFAPCTIYGRWRRNMSESSVDLEDTTEYSAQRNKTRLVLRFPEFSNLTGKVIAIRLNYESSYRAYVKELSNLYVRLSNSKGAIADLAFLGNSTGSASFRSTTNTFATTKIVYAPDEKDVKDLAELYIDAEFNFFADVYPPQDNFGSFALYAFKIEAIIETQVKDGDKFIVSANSTVSGEPYAALSDLVGNHCQNMFIATGEDANAPVSAIIAKPEGLRDTMRDILSQSFGVLYPSRDNDTINNLAFEVIAHREISAITEIDCDSEVFTDVMPEAYVETCPISDIYNAFRVSFSYDVGLGRYTKIAYVDADGYVLTGFDYELLGNSPYRCQFASQIIGLKKKVKSIEMRFAKEDNAMTMLEELSHYLCYPRKRAEVQVTIQNPVYLGRYQFVGSRLPADLLTSTWKLVGWSQTVSEGETKLQLFEEPQWPS